MSPKNNLGDSRPEKITVEKRGMLPPSGSLSKSDEKPAGDADIETKEEQRPLADHKVRLEPDEDGSISATASATVVPKTAPNLEEKPAAKDRSDVQLQTGEEDKNEGATSKPLARPAPPKPDPQEAAKKEAIEKLINDKKYNVPITHSKSHRSKRQFIITFVVVLVVGLFAINLAIDAGVIKTSIKPIVNLI